MTLKKEEKAALVVLRLQRAKETLAEVKENIKLGFWRVSANRLYYACYYAVIALLAKNNLTAHTHSGVISQLSLHFVKTGLLNAEKGKFYKQLFELRQTGDYDDWITIEEDDIIPLVEPAEKFIAEIDNLINK